MKLSWEVDGVEITVEKLENGLEAGMEDAVDKILEQLERKAKDRIAVRPYIFTGQVYESFTDQTTTADSSSGISARFINSAKHAGALEHGVHPSKYADGAPPVSALMPWVIAKLGDWTIDPESGGGSALQTPIPGDGDTTSNTIEDSTPDYEANWTRFHKNGYNEDELWIGQKVTFYDADAGKYRSGKITSVNLRGEVYVTPDSGDEIKNYDYKNGNLPDGSGLSVGEDWNSLSETEKRDIARDMLLNETNIDSDFSDSYAEKIRDVLIQYADNTKDPQEAKRLAMGINIIRKDNTMAPHGTWSGDKLGGTLKLNANTADSGTIRHEIGHAYLSSKKYDYLKGARHHDDLNGEKWKSIKNFKSGSLGWKYDSINKEFWDTGQAQPLPHPTTYMMYNSEDRLGVGIYDDVDHKDFDLWEEHVRKQTKYDLQKSTGGIHPDDPPNYDPFFTERQVLDPDGGAASPGDALKINVTHSDGRSKDFHGKVEHLSRNENGVAVLTLSIQAQEKEFPITDDGEFMPDEVEFLGFLPNGAKNANGGSGDTLDKANIPDDPGFYSDPDEVDEQFKEAINRHLWREMIATEIGDFDNRAKYYLRYDGYSATNAQETVAHLMAIIFSHGQLTSSDEANLKNLLETSPELLYMASVKFDFSPEMVDELERESGISFDDLMFDIYREHIQ